MPANARKDIVREGEIGTYHCWSRCVQRAFLCGYDPVTERDFDYRRGWIEDLLAYQARVFAIDVGNFNWPPLKSWYEYSLFPRRNFLQSPGLMK